MLSDVTAVGDWPIARQVVEALDDGDEDAEPEDLETVQPAGDLDIFADLGVDAMEVSAVCGDLELYPDEMLAPDRRPHRLRPAVRPGSRGGGVLTLDRLEPLRRRGVLLHRRARP